MFFKVTKLVWEKWTSKTSNAVY